MENAGGDGFNEFLMDIPSFWCIICLCIWIRSYLPPKKYWWQYILTCTVYSLSLLPLALTVDVFYFYDCGIESSCMQPIYSKCLIWRSWNRPLSKFQKFPKHWSIQTYPIVKRVVLNMMLTSNYGLLAL